MEVVVDCGVVGSSGSLLRLHPSVYSLGRDMVMWWRRVVRACAVVNIL